MRRRIWTTCLEHGYFKTKASSRTGPICRYYLVFSSRVSKSWCHFHLIRPVLLVLAFHTWVIIMRFESHLMREISSVFCTVEEVFLFCGVVIWSNERILLLIFMSRFLCLWTLKAHKRSKLNMQDNNICFSFQQEQERPTSSLYWRRMNLVELLLTVISDYYLITSYQTLNSLWDPENTPEIISTEADYYTIKQEMT